MRMLLQDTRKAAAAVPCVDTDIRRSAAGIILRRNGPYRNIDFTKSAVSRGIFFGFARDLGQDQDRAPGAAVGGEPALPRRRRRAAAEGRDRAAARDGRPAVTSMSTIGQSRRAAASMRPVGEPGLRIAEQHGRGGCRCRPAARCGDGIAAPPSSITRGAGGAKPSRDGRGAGPRRSRGPGGRRGRPGTVRARPRRGRRSLPPLGLAAPGRPGRRRRARCPRPGAGRGRSRAGRRRRARAPRVRSAAAAGAIRRSRRAPRAGR